MVTVLKRHWSISAQIEYYTEIYFPFFIIFSGAVFKFGYVRDPFFVRHV